MARTPTRWDADRPTLGDPLDEVFDRLLGFSPVPRYGLQHSWRPAVDVFRDRDGLAVVVEIPGVEQDEIQVTVESQRLRIAGTRRPPHLPDADPQRLEIEYGPFERIVALPDDSDSEHITAQLRQGLLTVHVPLRRAAQMIDVRVDSNPDATNE